MKKVLGLLFISASIFSMQVATIGTQCERAKRFHYQLSKHHSVKPDMCRKDIKQQAPKLNIDIKDCIQSKSVSAPKGLGEIKLFHNEKGFHVLHNDVLHRVQPCFTDKLVRKATSYDIKDFQKKGKGYFAITQMGDGQFELKVMDRVKGGGVIGASIGAFAGKAATYIVCHGAIQAVAIASGPLYWPTLWTLEGWYAVPIEALSMKAAIAGGVLGAVATGPV